MPTSNQSITVDEETGKITLSFVLGENPQVTVAVTETDTGTLFFNLLPTSFDGDIADLDGLFFNLTDDSDLGALNFFPDADNLPVTGHSVDANETGSLLDHPDVVEGYDAVINFGLMENSNQGEVPGVNFTLWSDNGPLTLDDLDMCDFALVTDGDDGMPEVLEGGFEMEMLVNGDLESGVTSGFRINGEVDGWTNDNGGIETWSNGFKGVQTDDGGSFIELDRNTDDQVDNLYQDIQTEEGRIYEMSFKGLQRGNDQDSIEVYWNGELVDTVTPDSNTDWEEFNFQFVGTGGEDRLEFRELASENDCTGPLMDAITLVDTCEDFVCEPGEDILVNGDMASEGFRGNWTANGEVEGWANDNGGLEVWKNGFKGYESEGSGRFIELDRHTGDTPDNLYQDVQTEEGETYEMKFSALQRDEGNDSIEVYWNGELIDTVIPASNSEWEEFSYEVTGTGGMDRLEFRELASESDCMGPLMDSISLCETCDPEEGNFQIEDLMVDADLDAMAQEAMMQEEEAEVELFA